MKQKSTVRAFITENGDRITRGVASVLLTVTAVLIALYSASHGSVGGVLLACLIASAPALVAFVSVRSLVHDYRHPARRR